MQGMYGVHQQDERPAVATSNAESVSRISLDTFIASYQQFRGKFLKPNLGPKLPSRVRWAIPDETKFEGLIKTLRDFVDNLFWLVSVERTVQDHIVEEDILAVTDLLDLEIIRDTSEHDYQGWSDVASRAVERTEKGTVPYTDLRDQEQHDENIWATGNLPKPNEEQAVGKILEIGE